MDSVARDKFWFGFIAALSISAWDSPALGAEMAKTVKKGARTLIVVAPKTTSNLAVPDLMTALRSQLEELDISVVLSSESFATGPTGLTSQDGRDVLAFVWLVEQDGTLTIHFYEAAGASLRERRIPVSGTDAINLEEVAIIVRSSVSALLERAERERNTEPVVTPVDEEPAPVDVENSEVVRDEARDPPSPVALDFGLTLSRYAPQTSYQQGLRGLVTVAPTRSFWEVGAAYTYVPATSVDGGGASITLARHPIELIFAADYMIPRAPLFVGGSLGMIVDPILRRTTATEEGIVAEQDEWRTSWATSAHLRAGVQATTSLRFLVAAGAEVLLRSHAQVLGGEESQVLVAPHRVRPHVFAGISLNVP